MIRLVEQTAIEAVAPHLAPGQTTVGTRVDIAHLAATPVGMTVTITVELTEVDRRRLAFRVEVRDELDEAGKGTHERFIIDGAQRLPRLEDKLQALEGRRRLAEPALRADLLDRVLQEGRVDDLVQGQGALHEAVVHPPLHLPLHVGDEQPAVPVLVGKADPDDLGSAPVCFAVISTTSS